MSNDDVTALYNRIDAIPGQVEARIMNQMKPYLEKLEEHDAVLYGPNKDDGIVTDMKETREVIQFIKGVGGKVFFIAIGILVLSNIYLIIEHPAVIHLP